MQILNRIFGIENLLPKGMEHGELPGSGSMYSTYIRMAIPSLLEMTLISLINMMDTIMVSGIGTDAVAAVGLCGQPRMLMLCMFFAINVGVTTVVARRKGEGRKEDANQTLRNALVLVVAIAAVLIAIGLPLAEPLMRFAGAEEGRTLADSTKYFQIISSTLPLQAVTMCICAAQRGSGNTKLTMVVNISSNLVNILGNWLLINGIGPFPKLGVVGAAIATAIGMVAGFILSIFATTCGEKDKVFLKLTFRADWRMKKQMVKDVIFVAKNAMVEQIAMRIGFFSYAKIIASLGTDAFAAHQITAQFMSISFSCADGLGVAGTSLVGQMLGKKRPDLAHIYGMLAQRFSLCASLVIGGICIFLRGPLVELFISENATPGVREMAENLMLVLGVFQPFQMLSTVISGALRGAGDVKYTAKVMALTVAVMRTVLALAAVYFIGNLLGNNEWALIGAWLAALTDMITRMFLFRKRYNSGNWHTIKV